LYLNSLSLISYLFYQLTVLGPSTPPIMAEVAEFKEHLTQAMITLNPEQFTQLLLTPTHPPLPTLIDRQGYTSKCLFSAA